MSMLRFSLCLAFCMSLVMTLVCYLGAGPLVTAFLDNPKAYDYGMSFARIYILSGPVLGLLFVFINAIQSTGAALPSLILSISRQGLLYIPTLVIMSNAVRTARGAAMAQPVTDYLATAFSAALFLITYKKYFRGMDGKGMAGRD